MHGPVILDIPILRYRKMGIFSQMPGQENENQGNAIQKLTQQKISQHEQEGNIKYKNGYDKNIGVVKQFKKDWIFPKI